jgi:hypothetical protein
MNKKIKEHLEKFNKKHGYSLDEISLIETLKECGKDLYRGDEDEHRWYTNYFYVKDIDGMLIGYVDAVPKDENATLADMGIEFDINSICEVVPEEKVITIYKPINKE